MAQPIKVNEINLRFNPNMFSPLHWHLMPALRDPRIRYIFIEGGSSAAKTFEICRGLLMDMYRFHYGTMVFRRFGVDINDSIYSSFKAAARTLAGGGWSMYDQLLPQQHLIKFRHNEAAKIRFRGLDNEENIKGIEGFNVVYNNEWSQFLESHWDQQRKRLRGRENQKFICDWNPVSAKLWQYEKWLDTFQWQELPLSVIGSPTPYTSLNQEHSFKRINKEGNALWMKVTYRDNFWVVGHPSGKGGYIDQATLDDFERDRLYKPNQYRIYANGERGIMRTGGEFWKQFDESKHVAPVKYEPGPVHITLDENVNPYVTIALWQVHEKTLVQIGEILAKTPDNNAPKAALQLVKWLLRHNHEDMVYIYGDPSAGKRSTVDPNNASFYDKFAEVLRKGGYHLGIRVGKSAPQVALSGAFINEIYETSLFGWSILIGDQCKESIEDYSIVKEDAEGKMLKVKEKDKATGVTFEPNGHLSDAKRYFITTILAAEFARYKAKNKRTGVYSVPG